MKAALQPSVHLRGRGRLREIARDLDVEKRDSSAVGRVPIRKVGVGGGGWGHERPEALRCASGKPRMAENRYSGPEHWPRQRRREIGTRLPLMEGAAPQGRCFAIGSRPEAAPIVSGHVLGDGSEGSAKESSKKTYEIFFQGHSRLRRS